MSLSDELLAVALGCARARLDVLKTVVVQGTVSRDAAGNTRVLATGLHVMP